MSAEPFRSRQFALGTIRQPISETALPAAILGMAFGTNHFSRSLAVCLADVQLRTAKCESGHLARIPGSWWQKQADRGSSCRIHSLHRSILDWRASYIW